MPLPLRACGISFSVGFWGFSGDCRFHVRCAGFSDFGPAATAEAGCAGCAGTAGYGNHKRAIERTGRPEAPDCSRQGGDAGFGYWGFWVESAGEPGSAVVERAAAAAAGGGAGSSAGGGAGSADGYQGASELCGSPGDCSGFEGPPGSWADVEGL